MSIPIFILTLEGEDDRRKNLLETLDENRVSYQIWYGIDGRDGLADRYEKMIDRKTADQALGRNMGNAEFACALSHHLIYREVLDRNLSHALVLEDDAIVTSDFFQLINEYKTRDYDLLLLDHMRADVFRSDNIVFNSNLVAYRVAFPPMLTTGYIVSNHAAKILVGKSLPIVAPADWPIDIAAMQSFAMDPRVVDHPDQQVGPSHIRAERTPVERKRQRASRFLKRAYWLKKWRKVRSTRISE